MPFFGNSKYYVTFNLLPTLIKLKLLTYFCQKKINRRMQKCSVVHFSIIYEKKGNKLNIFIPLYANRAFLLLIQNFPITAFAF